MSYENKILIMLAVTTDLLAYAFLYTVLILQKKKKKVVFKNLLVSSVENKKAFSSRVIIVIQFQPNLESPI